MKENKMKRKAQKIITTFNEILMQINFDSLFSQKEKDAIFYRNSFNSKQNNNQIFFPVEKIEFKPQFTQKYFARSFSIPLCGYYKKLTSNDYSLISSTRVILLILTKKNGWFELVNVDFGDHSTELDFITRKNIEERIKKIISTKLRF